MFFRNLNLKKGVCVKKNNVLVLALCLFFGSSEVYASPDIIDYALAEVSYWAFCWVPVSKPKVFKCPLPEDLVEGKVLNSQEIEERFWQYVRHFEERGEDCHDLEQIIDDRFDQRSKKLDMSPMKRRAWSFRHRSAVQEQVENRLEAEVGQSSCVGEDESPGYLLPVGPPSVLASICLMYLDGHAHLTDVDFSLMRMWLYHFPVHPLPKAIVSSSF
jgi:hypothetical protein